jgi:RNA polymerase sigma-70 factor (ECF subfamily)
VAAGVRHGERAAYDRSATEAGLLFERYSDRILAYCLHALRDRGEAEDAVQTTFLHAHRALQRGVSPEHEFAWLHTIAKNVCRTQKRTAARRAVVTGVDLDALPGRADAVDGERALLLGLGDALAAMSEGQRRALLLREWQGLSSGEVASQLGMSAPATYALLTRARRSLVRALTTVRDRPVLGLNLGPLVLRFKALVGGGVAKAVTTTAIVTAMAVGGVTSERALVERPDDAGTFQESAFRAETASTTATPVRTVRTVGPAVPATRRAAPASPRARARRGGDATPTTVGEADVGDPPTTVSPRTEPGLPTETTGAGGTPSAVDGALEPVLDDVGAQLPLPELDLGVVSEIAPGELLPDVDEPPVTEPVPRLPPVPPVLPPLP